MRSVVKHVVSHPIDNEQLRQNALKIRCETLINIIANSQKSADCSYGAVYAQRSKCCASYLGRGSRVMPQRHLSGHFRFREHIDEPTKREMIGAASPLSFFGCPCWQLRGV